ncbi:MAG: FAD-binding oxidoreductase [Pseudomonadota bacterium]
MNPLYRNDKPGAYPKSYYAATSVLPPGRAALDHDLSVDLVVIGAGFTGLSTALHAAEKGLDVAVLEAHRVGFGASGRNGGQVGSGWNWDQRKLEARVGKEDARKLWDLTVEAKALTRQLVAQHAPDAAYKPGVLEGHWTNAAAKESRAYGAWLAENYGYPTEYLDRDAIQQVCCSPVYAGGLLDRDAGHLHPLRYVLGLAAAAERAGARIFERTEALALTETSVRTPKGTVSAKHIVVAGNGYLPDISDDASCRVMPINSFIAATEPLGDLATKVLAEDIAVADDKFVVNYFRLSEDKRLLFGGRESYSVGFPTDIDTALRKRMLHLFPQLADVRIDYSWGGTLGITMSRLPMVRRIGPNTLAAGGFSGHGVAITGLVGKILAEAVSGQLSRFDLLGQLPVSRFPGGKHARAPLLTLAMTWYALRDRLGL